MKNLADLRVVKIGEILEKRRLLSEEDRVSQAVGEIRETGTYEVFLRKGRRVAIATVRDLLSVDNPHESRLGTVSYFVPELKENDDLGKVARLMFDYRLRAMPARSDGDTVQVVSARGMAQLLSNSGTMGTKASEIMTGSPVTMQGNELASKARETMLRKNFDHLPVMKGGEVSGILTSRHLLLSLLPAEGASMRALGGRKQVRFDFPVERLAEAPVIETTPDADLSIVAEAILRRSSTYSLVIMWAELQGIITLRDIIRLLEPGEKVEEVPFYIIGLPRDPFEAEAARLKFERMAIALRRSFPFIEEVRAVIKTKEISSDRRRYELSVNIYTPRESYSFVEEGYDLPQLFDKLSPEVKRIGGSKQSKVTKSGGRTLRKGDIRP
jgi:CBS domain-containing protein